MTCINKERAYDMLLLVLVVAVSCLYFLLNKPQESVRILRTVFDNQIPRIPFFSIIYLAFLPWLWCTVLYIWIKKTNFHQLAYSIIIVNLIAFFIYLTFQTHIPREPIIDNDLFSNLLRFIYSHDNSYNCFPSLHVALSAVIATFFVRTRHKWSWIFVLVAVLISISTLFVKQHFVVDVASGTVLGIGITLAIFWLSSVKAKKNEA